MTVREVEMSAKVQVPLQNMVKIACVWLLACMVWLCPVVACAEESGAVQENPPSNEEFLRGTIRSLFERAFVDFPDKDAKLLVLRSEEQHPAGWLLEDELVFFLLSLDREVALQSVAPSRNLEESQQLFYRIIDMNLSYPEVKRRGFLGGRILTRRAALNLSFRLEDGATGKVLWSEKVKEERSDVIKRSMAKSVNNKTYPFLSPSLPEDPQSKYLEPALVISVVGGLIYLFFANR